MSETSSTEVRSSGSSEIFRHEHHKELKELKGLITTLQKYVNATRLPSDDKLHNLQESGEKLLVVLKGSSHAALYCANFIVTMMTILPESPKYFKGSRIRSVLQALIDNVKDIDSSETGLAVEFLWKSILKVDLTLHFVEYSSDRFTCMFPHLLLNSFNYLRHTESSLLYNLMDAIGVKCLLHLAQYPTNKATHESLNIILMQLVKPHSKQSKLLAQGVLKTCGYHITDAIRQLLNPVLVRGHPEETDPSICDFVYSAVYELLIIDQTLVIGLINNTQLCLNTGRVDRCAGIEFLTTLFSGENIPGMPNPSLFFRTLWRQFSAYCCQTVLTCKAEEMLIARSSTNFLVHQPDLAVIWCSVLRHRLLNYTDSECVHAFTQSIAGYFLHDFPSTNASKSMEIDTLIKDLLRIGGPNELSVQYRITFIQQLATVYEKIVDDGINFSNLKRASAVLEYIYFVCDKFDPLNEDWHLLRTVFINHLVPWDLDCNERVKRFLLLFIITEPRRHQTLHQLFYRTHKVRTIVRWFLKDSQHLYQKFFSMKMCQFLVNAYMSPQCIYTQILGEARKNLAVRELFTKVVDFSVTCTASKEACDSLKQLLVSQGKKEREIINSFLFYLAEPTFDASFFQVIVTEVNSYITEDGDLFSNPKSALLALGELIYIRPELGFTIEFVNQLKGWIENACDGVLIRLMFECFIKMGRYHQLELWNPNYTQDKLIPFWLEFVESGNREETKLAIQCLAVHLKNFSDTEFKKVLKILDNQLKNASNLELYEHGLSALGHVAKVCSSLSVSVRDEVNKIAVSRVLENLFSQEDCWAVATSYDHECQWLPWTELNIGIRLQVQSLRTLGRCMRHTGKEEDAKAFLKSMEFALNTDEHSDYSKIDWDWVRLESASAVLNIWERKGISVRRGLMMKLSHLLTDDNFMVRKLLAEKLRRGLTPEKVWVDEKGKSKGSIPSVALGLLAVLGLNDDREHLDQSLNVSYEEEILIEVFQSYRNRICQLACSVKGPDRFVTVCQRAPVLLPEYALVHAVPVLAEHPVLNLPHTNESHSFDSFELEEDAILKAWKCLSFLSKILGGMGKNVPPASKSFVMEMAKKARETIKPPDDEVKFKKYLTLCDLLLLVAEHHSVWGSEQMNLPVELLPGGYFSSDPLMDRRCEVGNLISGNMVTKLLSSHTNRVVLHGDSEVESSDTSHDYKEREVSDEEELSEDDASTSGTLSWGCSHQRNLV